MPKANHAETVQRFWAKTIRVGECLEWTASKNKGGYGQFNAGNRRIILAHRYSWEITYGPIINNFIVCHHCDNRKCVEPKHLFLGTYKDNNQDMFAKGRGHVFDGSHILGEQNINAKLTQETASEAKGLLNAGASLGYLAKKFSVTRQTIVALRDGNTWGYVKPKKINSTGPMKLDRPKAEFNIQTKMTWENVTALRKLRRDGAKINALAEKFAISPSTVKQIVSGKTWKDETTEQKAAAKAGSAQFVGTAKHR